MGEDEPPEGRRVPRLRHHQPVRGLRGAPGARLGRLPREIRQHPAARSDTARRGQRPRPLQGGQAGRHGDAVLPVLRRRAAPAFRVAGLQLRLGHGAQEHLLLRPAHLTRLDAELHRARGGLGGAGPGELVAAVPRCPRERRRRRPDWDHEGGHPHGRHVRDARPRPAQLHGHAHPRRRPVLRPQAHRPARRVVVLDAVSGDPHPGDVRRRPAHGGRPSGGREPAGQGCRPRRGARATCRGPVHVRAPAGPESRATGQGLTGGPVPTRFQGAIFDVDGVLVDSPHEKAWRESLRELMEGGWSDIRDETTWSPGAFTPHVYQEQLSGKPRMSGARAALEYFGVPDVDARVGEYAARKQVMVVRLIQAGDFTAYPDALRFVIATKDAGMLIADASSSKNAGLFLRQIRLDTFAQEHGISSPTLRPGLTLLDYFDADVSGRDFARGKPDPEIFLTAAHALGVEPRHAMVIQDASAGVHAAKAGGMAAVGIARADDADLLAAAGADLVVTTLDDVDTTALAAGRLATRKA